MKVKITKCSNKAWWYADCVGATYPGRLDRTGNIIAIQKSRSEYECAEVNGYVDRDDCEVLG